MNWIKKLLGLKTEKQCAIHIVSYRFTKDDIETLKEHRDLMNDVITGDYKPDSFTNQPLNILIDRIENGG